MFWQLIRSSNVRLIVWIGLAAVAYIAIGPPRDADPSAPPPAVETLPVERGGQDRVGRPLPPLRVDRWIEVGADKPLRPAAKQVTLYRWWTDRCPYCAASLPALERLREKYAPRGLAVVGVFHPKPPRATDDAAIRSRARELGFRGMLAVDEDWSELRVIEPKAGRRLPTSMSFLVDGAGIVRFVHPGPALFPSADPAHAQENDDFGRLEQAIRVLLDLPSDPRSSGEPG